MSTSRSATLLTDTPAGRSQRKALGDYEIRLTGSSSTPLETGRASEDSLQSLNSQFWPQDYHRIPAYRPINRQLDWAQRPVGSNAGEQVFLHVMFAGVSLNAGVAQLWGGTGGKIFTNVFKYAVGGEW